MPRLQLFEFEDQPWFPAILRRYMQDFLELMGNFDPASYGSFVQRLKPAMASMGETKLVDLCSGGAGPVRAILAVMGRESYPVTATLTDLYPNLDAFERTRDLSNGQIAFVPTSVDATNVPADLTGFRLLSNSFHHFKPDLARAILADAVAKKRGIAVVEVVGRSVPALLSVFIGLIFCLLMTPFLKPFRVSRLILTYVIPVIPVFILFDGLASCLRTYSMDELTELTRGLGTPDEYRWELGRLPLGRSPMKLTYLIGAPVSSDGPSATAAADHG